MTLRLSDLCTDLKLEHLTPTLSLDREVGSALVGDLLSDVLAAAKPGDVWVTVQRHQNVIAVARVTDLAAVVLARGVRRRGAADHRAGHSAGPGTGDRLACQSRPRV